MKTLYININGENIQSANDIIVVGGPEDAIVNKFYYELGKEIFKGVDVSISRDINKKSIITDFMARDKDAYDAIWKEWEAVKDKLLGENPTGMYKVTLPPEYISWLNNNGQVAYSEIAKSLHDKGGVVEISIDKIYRNAIGIIVNSIEPSECKDCKQFVVNDRCVTDDSAISLAIMEKVKGIVFVSYDDIICSKCGKFPCECDVKVCPVCGKNPCECKPVCPKCGKNPCECKKEKEWSTADDLRNGIIILAGITLNKTTLKELREKGIIFKNDDAMGFTANINDDLFVSIPHCRFCDLDELDSIYGRNNMDDAVLVNEGKVVKMMEIKIKSKNGDYECCPFFENIGLSTKASYDEFIDFLEDCGLIRCECPFGESNSKDYFFINPDSWVLIVFNYDSYDISISFMECFLKKLTTYYTGKVLSKNA